MSLWRNGYVVPKTQMGAISPSTGRTLPDRYIEGTCPICGYDGARGDQCDNCGNQLDPVDLIKPVSRINGETPKFIETEHLFLDLPAFTTSLGQWLSARTEWRPNVLKFSTNLLDDLRPRAITRDLDWGIPVPTEELGPDKRIYVWFENVIGYLSAAKEWAQRRGEPEAWRQFWQDPDCRSYYFIGKDNIFFHTISWPVELMAYGDAEGQPLNRPYDVPANQFMNIGGLKASTSRSWAVWIPDLIGRYDPDAMRYYLCAIMPETDDSDFTWKDFVARNNNELVATWGNLAHRALTLTYRHFAGRVPEPGEPSV
jgi:methionyl-tRNA synthetase